MMEPRFVLLAFAGTSAAEDVFRAVEMLRREANSDPDDSVRSGRALSAGVRGSA